MGEKYGEMGPSLLARAWAHPGVALPPVPSLPSLACVRATQMPAGVRLHGPEGGDSQAGAGHALRAILPVCAAHPDSPAC